MDKCTHFLDICGEVRNFSEIVAVVACPNHDCRHVDLVSIFQVLLLNLNGTPDDDVVSVRPFTLRKDAGISAVDDYMLCRFK